MNDPYALTTTQILAEQTPILPQTSVYPATTNSNQWKGTSYSSLNHNDIHLTASPSIDIDAPKLHTPFVPLSSKPSKRESTRTDSQSRFDQTYYSSSNITNPIQTNRPYPGTYNSLPDTEIVYNGNLTQLTPTQSYSKFQFLFILINFHFAFSWHISWNKCDYRTSSRSTSYV